MLIASSSESVSPAGAMAANDHTFGATAAPGDHPPADSDSADEVESADEVVTFPIQNRSEFGGAAF